MRRVTVSFLVALSLATVAAGEALRSLMALRDGGTWINVAVAVAAGVVLFLSLVVLLRILTAIGRMQRRPRGKGAVQAKETRVAGINVKEV